MSNYDVPCKEDFDARSVAAVGTIQEIESLRSSAALDIDSYAAYLSDGRFVAASYTSKKKSIITAEDIARRWKCGLDAAKRTLQVTTQLAVRDTTNVSGDKRLSPYANLLRYPKLQCDMYVDILVGKCVSLDGNKYTAFYGTIFGWCYNRWFQTCQETHSNLRW